MYKTLVPSHLDYCDIINNIPSRQTQRGVTPNALMEKTERIQYQAELAVTGAWSSYSKTKLPGLRRPLDRQSSSNTFHELKRKSLRYMSSFFPDAITSWNNVIIHFDDILSFNVLKTYFIFDSSKENIYILVYMILQDFGTSSN